MGNRFSSDWATRPERPFGGIRCKVRGFAKVGVCLPEPALDRQIRHCQIQNSPVLYKISAIALDCGFYDHSPSSFATSAISWASRPRNIGSSTWGRKLRMRIKECRFFECSRGRPKPHPHPCSRNRRSSPKIDAPRSSRFSRCARPSAFRISGSREPDRWLCAPAAPSTVPPQAFRYNRPR